MDDVSWVSVIELGHGDVDELHLLHLQHLDPLLQLPQLELVRHLRLLLQNQCSQLNEQSHSLGDVSTVGSSEHLEAGNILGFFSLKNQNNKLKIKRTTPSAIDNNIDDFRLFFRMQYHSNTIIRIMLEMFLIFLPLPDEESHVPTLME